MATYSYITLDGPYSSPVGLTGINNAGQFLGNFSDSTGTHGSLYSGGVYTTIDDPVGTVGTTLANGINNPGQIVGSYSNASGTYGFLYSGGTYTTLNDPLAGPHGYTTATGINDSGQIVGSYEDSSNHTHGFLYSGGVYTTIDDPSVNITNGSTQAIGINNAGQIVGGYSATSGDYGFLYSNGTYTTLQDPLAGTNNNTVATGINNQGQIVGNYSYGQGYNGFIYSNGTYTTIDDPLAPAGFTQVNGINDIGEFVGLFRNSLDSENPLPPGHGFFAFDAPQLPPTTIQQEIAGLYAAVYNRTADASGMQYWDNVVAQQPDASGVTFASAANTPISTSDASLLGQMFVATQSAYFSQTYGNLNDSDFVIALYLNMGGQNAETPSAITYWQNIIQTGEASGLSVQNARASMVGQFVHDLIDVNLTQWTTLLTPSELETTILRQATVDNKLAVSLAYVAASASPNGSFLNAQVVGDAAFQTEVRALTGVAVDPFTATVQITGINQAVADHNLADIQPA